MSVMRYLAEMACTMASCSAWMATEPTLRVAKVCAPMAMRVLVTVAPGAFM